jgi:hypothetical protein
MQSAVCTLFEGHYHYGLAALINSLYKNEFRGDVYVGYKGSLPFWASGSVENDGIKWAGVKTLTLSGGLQIHFMPLDTKAHLTNYKPDFMLRLFDGPAKEAAGLLYFDPDIVVRCKWSFYETWINHGVALVHEITANDMPASHPIRKEWVKVIERCNLTVKRNLTSYINAGFCGVNSGNIEFLKKWSLIIDTAVKDYAFKSENFKFSSRTEIFFAGDQDAFNIAAMSCDSDLSEIGPDGMDFVHGGFTMSHAIGAPKPWKKNFFTSSFKGIGPTMADKRFWANSKGPIECYSKNTLRIKRLSMIFATLLGRFYAKK